jgi:diaminohydroxyphosphoribosylaminopyrimidine deaminase/5-amino-6-(5-phosphoribosylamino)uracil reductase
MNKDERYIQRCFDLARLGAGYVSPNPMVGAVLVHGDRIIGEGYHQAYGQAHAEVNALASVAEQDRPFIKDSTLYVSLEPCCIHGNTPPCTSLIIREHIPKVVISALDQTPGVAGQGVRILEEASVQVIVGVLAKEGERLSAIRNTFVTQLRPYVLLKYAKTIEGFFARSDGKPYWISNAFSKRLVHKWRSEVDAILVSGRTAQLDNPQLTNRLYFGPSPRRIVVDRQLQVPAHHYLLDQSVPTLLFYDERLPSPVQRPGVQYIPLPAGRDLMPVLSYLHAQQISTLMVEGGATLLRSFVEQGLWDEARIFQGSRHLNEGIPAPDLPAAPSRRIDLDDDQLLIYYR